MFCAIGLGLGPAGCASAPHAPPVSPTAMSEAEEARAIEAAKHNPIAQPRARPLYPDQAPSPIPERGPPLSAPPDILGREADGPVPDAQAYPAATAPVAPPNEYVDAPQYAAPGPDYVWAPGYWSWSGTNYVWVGGDWLRARPGYVYVGPRWARTRYGWEFSAGGWSRGGGGFVVDPVHRYPYHPYQEYYSPGYYGSRRIGGSNYNDRSADYGDRRSDVSSSAPRSGRANTNASPSMPSARDSEPTPRSAPASHESHEARSAPSVTQAVRVGGGGGRSSSRATVHVRH